MTMPFIILNSCYHVGSLNFTKNRINPRAIKNWDVELGLFSISLVPKSWVARAPLLNPTTYQITSPVKLLDADSVLAQKRASIETQARAKGLLSSSSVIQATNLLYRSLDLTNGTITAAGSYIKEDWELLSCLACLASVDPSIDGLWFSNLHGGAFPSGRGGIYQHRLSTDGVSTVAPCIATPAPPAVFLPTLLVL